MQCVRFFRDTSHAQNYFCCKSLNNRYTVTDIYDTKTVFLPFTMTVCFQLKQFLEQRSLNVSIRVSVSEQMYRRQIFYSISNYYENHNNE